MACGSDPATGVPRSTAKRVPPGPVPAEEGPTARVWFNGAGRLHRRPRPRTVAALRTAGCGDQRGRQYRRLVRRQISEQARTLSGEAALKQYAEPLWRRIANGPAANDATRDRGADPEAPAVAPTRRPNCRPRRGRADPCQGPFAVQRYRRRRPLELAPPRATMFRASARTATWSRSSPPHLADQRRRSVR